MPDLTYAVIGRGAWGKQIANILNGMGRSVMVLPISRRHGGQSIEQYQSAVNKHLIKSSCNQDVVWLAVPPNDQVLLASLLLENKYHVIVEKPWMASSQESSDIMATAQSSNRQISVHYQYCLLDELTKTRIEYNSCAEDVIFSGVFTIARPNRLKIPALANLGSHLLAIRQYHFPGTTLGNIQSAYESESQRMCCLQDNSRSLKVNFLGNREPLVQRFIHEFEASIHNDRPNRFGLEFAMLITKDIMAFDPDKRHQDDI